MVKYLDEEEEDLIMFVVEHLKDHKSPQKLIEGLEPVRFSSPCRNYYVPDMPLGLDGGS